MLNAAGEGVSWRSGGGGSSRSWTIGSFGSFSIAGAAVFALTMNAAFVESFSSARLAASLGALLLLHAIRFPEIVVTREARLYAVLVCYMLVQLAWTRDTALALNTIVPAIAFLLVLILFGSLLASHDRQPVLVGALAGFLLGAAAYTAVSRFPFMYPKGFSYNAIASIYLFGLFASLVLASLAKRAAIPLAIASAAFVHIMATTSIKTNLGLVIGALVAALFNLRYFARVLRRNAIVIAILAGGLAYGVWSNQALIDTVNRGVARVGLGVEVLMARENIAGYSGFERRSAWQRQGLSEWTENPVFGYGVEAFRSTYDITSHSTFVDVLYNSGLIGFALFYGILASLAWRLRRAGDAAPRALRAVIFAFGACYVFMTFAGNIHYSAFLAAFVAISTALLDRRTAA